MMAVLALGAAWTVFRAPANLPHLIQRALQPADRFRRARFHIGHARRRLHPLSELRGRPVMLNIWASWCLPCRTEMPAIQRVHQRLATGSRRHRAQCHLAGYRGCSPFVCAGIRPHLSIALDRDGSASAQYQLMGLPSTYFIDRQGIVRDVIIGGPMSEAVMLSKLQELPG